MTTKEDFERLKTIHAVKSVFRVSPETFQNLVGQIEDADKRNNIDRFLSGYEIEDVFEELFSQLPAVDLFHALKQEQSPSDSKARFQVPDFTVLLRSTSEATFAVLVETKSVLGQKLNLSLMSKQVEALQCYCSTLGLPLIYVIYWQRVSLWTTNAVDQFKVCGKQHRISFEDAYINDLSAIFGDETLMLCKSFYRRSKFDRDQVGGIRHQQYGRTITDEVSTDRHSFTRLEPLEAAVIDAVVTLREEKKDSVGALTEIIETNPSRFMLKLSTIVPRHLSMAGGVPLDEKSVRVSLNAVVSLAKKIGATFSTPVPAKRTAAADYVLKLAFGGSSIWSSYAAKR